MRCWSVPDNPFWKYSLALYANAQQWCLELQDRYGANVNLLLFCCFVGSRGCTLLPQHLDELRALIAGWDDGVVKPLRKIRRSLSASDLGSDVSAAKQLVLAAELEAEQQVQQRLHQWWLGWSRPQGVPPEEAVAANLNSYCEQLGVARPLPDSLIDLALSAAG